MTKSIKGYVGMGIVTVVFLLIGAGFMYVGAVSSHKLDKLNTQVSALKGKQTLTRFQRERPVYSEAETAIETFMSGYLTFNNQQDFDNRRKNVKQIITNDVYENRLLFKIDKYHKVRQLALEGTYVKSDVVPQNLSNNVLTATVLATQTLNFSGQKGKDTIKSFTVTYDGALHKITKVTPEGTFQLNADSSIIS